MDVEQYRYVPCPGAPCPGHGIYITTDENGVCPACNAQAITIEKIWHKGLCWTCRNKLDNGGGCNLMCVETKPPQHELQTRFIF